MQKSTVHPNGQTFKHYKIQTLKHSNIITFKHYSIKSFKHSFIKTFKKPIMKKNLFLSLAFALLNYYQTFAQSTTMSPNYVQIPNVITLPGCSVSDKGKTVFNTTDNKMYYCNSNSWVPVQNGASGTGWASNGNHISNSNTGNVGIGTNTPKDQLEIKQTSHNYYMHSSGLKLNRLVSGYTYHAYDFDNWLDIGTPNASASVKPTDFAIDGFGNIFIVYETLNRITKIGSDNIPIDWIFGSGLNQPNSINIDNNNSIFVTNKGNNTVLKISQTGAISTFGSGYDLPCDVTFGEYFQKVYV
jgi:hypothetical protein